MRVKGAWVEVAIANISASGLMVRSALAPSMGAEVELQRRGLTIKGVVVWSSSTRFGIRSFEPIDVQALSAHSGLRAEGRREKLVESSPDGDRRSIDRNDAKTHVEVRSNGRLLSVQLYDVSALGCRIRYLPGAFAQGDRISFKFLQMVRVSGTVAWLNGDHAGVEFDSPMHDAVAAHLGFSPALTPLPVQTTDHFGRAVPALRSPFKRRLP